MNFTLLITVLLFACSSSFSISKSKQPYHRHNHRKAERPDNNEVYKVEYSPNSLEFAYPKARAPTLREIVYYHVIERPNGEGSVALKDSSSYSGSVEDDAVVTERPFTNGHGYQFLPEPEHKNSTAEEEAVTTEVVEIQSEEATADDEEQDYEANEIEPTTGDTTTYEETEEYYDSPTIEDAKKEQEVEETSVNSPTTEEHITETIPAPSIDPRDGVNKDEVVEEKRDTRAAMFNQAKDKYHNRRMSNKQHRRKRHVEASEIPEAPTLPPLNPDSLPEYARKLLPTQKTATEKAILEEPETNETKLRKEIQARIEEMMATLKPAALQDDVPERDGSIEAAHGEKRTARTYGMNLTEHRGYVWNDLLGDPGMFIEVGDLEEKNEITQHNKPTDAPSSVTSSAHHPAESKPIYTEHSNEKDRDQDNKSEDLNDVFVEVKTNRPTDSIEHTTKKDIGIEQHTEITSDSSDTTVREDVHTDSSTESNKSTTESSANDPNKANLQVSTTESVIDVTTVKKHRDEIGTDKTDEGHDKNNGTLNEKARKAIMEVTQSELLQELLKNEQFWKWLGDWTNTYTEVLMKHVKHMIHEEVGRQMKTYTAQLKKEMQKDAEEASRLKGKESAKEDKEETNAIRDDNIHEDTSAVKHSEDTKALENEKQNHEDVKIIINGKELPLTHNSNLKGDDLLKHRKDKENDHRDPPKNTENELENKASNSKPTIAVTAQNVYGNSAGSDKVTNIFLFYPRDDAVIKDFRPTDDGDSLAIDKRREDDVADLVAQRDESTSTTDVPSKEVTTKTSAHNDVDVTTKPDAKEHKSDGTTQKAPTDSSKHIEKDSNKQQEHVKDKDDTTEGNSSTGATTIPNVNKSPESEDSTQKTEHKEKIADNKTTTDAQTAPTDSSKDIEKDSNKQQDHVKDKDDTTEANSTTEATTISNVNKSPESEDSTQKTEQKEKMDNNKIMTDEPSKDLKKDTVTTEHNDSEKNLDTTESVDEHTTEKATAAQTDKHNETTERTVVNKDIVKTSSAESEKKGINATITDKKLTNSTQKDSQR